MLIPYYCRYVDPGYADLNPAYDQPVNTRPVWGLAKPLPRVIRPGMVPTKSEIKAEIEAPQKQDPANVDLEQGRVEQGRVEPTLRVDRISSHLQNARKRREGQLLQTYDRTGSLPVSPLKPRTSNYSTFDRPLSTVSQAIEEEEDDLGLAKPSDEPVIPEQQGTAQPPQSSRPDWYPDDASDAATEHEAEDVLDGDVSKPGDLYFPSFGCFRSPPNVSRALRHSNSPYCSIFSLD